MNAPGGSESLPGLVGKAAIVLALAEKKKSPARNQCWSIEDQPVLAFLAEVSMQQRFVTTIREIPLTLTWFLTWSINPLIFTLLRHLGARAWKTRNSVGARQLVRGHRPAGAVPSGTRGRHTPVLA